MQMPTALLAAAPVVDLDGTIFVQGGLFLLMVVLLRPLLFRPWLELQDRREQAIGGATRAAEELRREAAGAGSDYDARLADARARAADRRASARREQEGERAKATAAVRAEAERDLDAARTRLRAEAEAARGQLVARVDELANQVVAKILGRAS
jgi:F-type H+-transporting ATPase subunit b